MADEVVALRGKLTTVAFLDKCNFQLRSECFSLCPQICVVLISPQRSLVLQQMETITETHIWLQGREQVAVGCPTPIDLSTNYCYSKTRGHLGREGQIHVRSSGPGHLLWDSVFYVWQGSGTYEMSTTRLSNQDLNNGRTIWYTNMDGENITRTHP